MCLYSCLSYWTWKSHLLLCRIILSFVACLDLPYFSALSHKRHVLKNVYIEYNMCVLIFVWNICHYRKNWARNVINIHRTSHKVPVLLARYSCHILMKLEFPQISWKSVQWERSSICGDRRRTVMAKLIVAFRNFVNAPKNSSSVSTRYLRFVWNPGQRLLPCTSSIPCSDREGESWLHRTH